MTENARSLSADLTGKLRIEILSERTRAGEKLTESAICKRYDVSRTPVREALQYLEAEGLVKMIPNRGAFVIGLTADDIRDLYAIRIQEEAQAVRWAIERSTKEEMETLEETLDFMRFYTKRNDVKRMRSINASFHKCIAAASHNRILADNLARIQDYIRHSVRVLPYHEDVLDSILEEHISIYTAFRDRDPEAGVTAMVKHLKNSLLRSGV